MSRSGNQLLTSLSRYIGDLDFPEGLTTTGAGSSTSLVDTALGRWGDDYLIDWYARITESVNGNQYLSRRISDFVQSTGTCTLSTAFPGNTGSGTDYELHRIAPSEKFSALDEARIVSYPALGILVVDDTLTSDGQQGAFAIPSTVRRGPIDVFYEIPAPVDTDWNLLPNPHGDDSSSWTATNATLSTDAVVPDNRLIPKYDRECTQFAVVANQAATIDIVIGDMLGDYTAADLAGQRVTFALWVYSRVPSKIVLSIYDDTNNSSSSTHQGRGWELLTVTQDVVGDNAVLLRARIVILDTAEAVTGHFARGWFYLGDADRVTESWEQVPHADIRRDNTTQQLFLTSIPPRGYQIRLVGRDVLSALGNSPTVQAENTMEVDEYESEILCAEATKILFQRGMLSYAAMQALAGPMSVNEARLKELKSKWKQHSPGPRMAGWWA